MARLPRLCVPGQPHHIIQRGTNRQAIALDAQDHAQLLDLIRQAAAEHGLAVHAYVLMGNHFHLLATPGQEAGLSAAMQAIGRSYVRRFNQRHGRTGTLWEGRFRSSVIESERHLLACMVYIDLNPVRAGLVAQAADYPWSSHRHYVGIAGQPWLTPHGLYWALGNTPFAREQAYAALVAQGQAAHLSRQFTDAALKGRVMGHADFLGRLQAQSGRDLMPKPRGRPRRTPLA